MERFSLRNLNESEVCKQYQIKISKGFSALENLNDNRDMNRALKNAKENISTSAKDNLSLYELNQH
jgi:ribosomal protein S25